MTNVLCDSVLISVVERTGSLGVRRPLESIRWDAKIVLIRVDFPRPVWPTRESISLRLSSARRYCPTHTDTHDIELEATLQQLALDLRGNAVKTDMAMGENSGLLSRSCGGSGGHYGRRDDIEAERKTEIEAPKRPEEKRSM